MQFGPLSLLREDPLAFFFLCVTLVFAISLHEYSHALAADLQGDRMPRAMGRLTPNPARHLDPLGTIMLLLVGFGWGKPVEFRPQALASKRFGPALVALAGPFMNLLLAFLAAVVAVTFREAILDNQTLELFLGFFFTINLFLAVFNLIPLPPLDGSRLLTIFLPPNKQRIVFWLDQYGFLILLALVFFGGLSFLDPIIESMSNFLFDLAGA